MRLIADADERHQLSQRERIALGLLGQAESMSAAELADGLDVAETAELRPWLGRLVELGLVVQSGRTKATRYFVPPALLREAGLDALTTLTRVQPHRLRALILEDLERFPDSAKGDACSRAFAPRPQSCDDPVRSALRPTFAPRRHQPSASPNPTAGSPTPALRAHHAPDTPPRRAVPWTTASTCSRRPHPHPAGPHDFPALRVAPWAW